MDIAQVQTTQAANKRKEVKAIIRRWSLMISNIVPSFTMVIAAKLRELSERTILFYRFHNDSFLISFFHQNNLLLFH